MTEAEARAFAISVWEGVNLPNWLAHIAPARAVADIILAKSRDHRLFLA